MASTSPPSRKNHYVPEWYQAGFCAPGALNFLLDISPPRHRPDGSPIVFVPQSRAPKSCFWEKDLYITRFGDVFNDQVETVLFQDIDDFGATAVRAFIDGDLVRMHSQHNPLLAYLGAQKLRTPKGLDWIRSRYPSLTQVELLIEMQQLRQMFGTLWAESVREIVSAEDSEVKFLVSDHPVTTFNAAMDPTSASLAYPNDPDIRLNGTQTLFVLDANRCLILTHVPYAKDPDGVSLLRKRINARYFGSAMIKADALIRHRRLSVDEVIAINYLLKDRARRYLAAAQEPWLYPERHGPFSRERTAQVLRPPEKGLWSFGGEIYIGHKDGTTSYHDQFGRTSLEHEFVAKKLPAHPPAPDAPCPCGTTGVSFAACCQPTPVAQRPRWDVMSLRERNLGLLNAVVGILQLDNKTWKDVRRELSDEQVVRLHRVMQGLWPEDTDLTELLPASGDGKSRAVFLGISDPRTVGESVISLVPLFDQVLVLNPFLNPRLIAPDFSPLKDPAAYKQQLLKNILFLMTLAPLIEANKVLLFPDPCEMNYAFGTLMRKMAAERAANWKMTEKHREQYLWLLRDDTKRSMLQMPPEFQAGQLRKASPGISDQEVADAIAYMRSELEADELALLQAMKHGEPNGHYHVLRGVNLELAHFLAQLTGAAVVTDSEALWEHLHLHTRAVDDLTDGGDPSRFARLDYRAYIHPQDVLAAAELPSATSLRQALFELQQDATPATNSTVRLAAARTRFAQTHVDLGERVTYPHYVVPMELTVSMPSAGFESASAQRLNVAFGRDQAPIAMPLAIFRRTIKSTHGKNGV